MIVYKLKTIAGTDQIRPVKVLDAEIDFPIYCSPLEFHISLILHQP